MHYSKNKPSVNSITPIKTPPKKEMMLTMSNQNKMKIDTGAAVKKV